MAKNNSTNTDIVPGGGYTYTFPSTTTTLVGTDTTDTLTNKTLTTPRIVALKDSAGNDTISITSPSMGVSKISTLQTVLDLEGTNVRINNVEAVNISATQTLTNKTLTSPKLNENVAITATATEVNVLDGITATTAELNILDGVTATVSELNILDGATLSTTELNYVDGVTSAIQTQLDAKRPLAPRVGTVASSATPAINTDTMDAFSITALATAITSFTANLTGTPTNFQPLLIRIKDNGTARAITWGASFQDGSVALPITTTAGKTLLVGLKYDSVDSKWTCEAVGERA